jgi:hypothetical protein
MKLTKKEIRDIRDYDKSFSVDKIRDCQEARGQVIKDIIVVSHGRKELHDSGYPFIKFIGRQYEQSPNPDIKYFDLGWHDHFLCHIPVNIDSFGKNIFHIFPWGNIGEWVVSPCFIPLSTFEIGCAFPNIHPINTLS